MSEWQPIETAPKDVMFIAYYIGYKRPFIAWWNVADQCFESDSSIIMDDGPENPTHWMPLPEVPNNVDDREAKGRNRPPKGESTGNAKLTDVEVLSMRRLRMKGETFASIAERFSINKKTAIQAIKGQTWTHVPFPPNPPSQ